MDALIEELRPVVDQYGAPFQRLQFLGTLFRRNLRRDRMLVSDETLACARESFALQQKLMADPGEVAAGRFCLGFTLVLRGELDEAQEHLEAALQRAEQVGDVTSMTFCLNYRTILARKRGCLDDARHYASRTLEAAAAAGRPEYTAMAQANQAWVAWREGDLPEAQAKAQAALPVLQQGSLAFAQWAARWPLIGVALAEDRLREAIDHARGLLDPAVQPLPDSLAAALQDAIQLYESGEPVRVRACFHRAAELARETGYL
jgi:tetratricopeptide (TPR) repeat protein